MLQICTSFSALAAIFLTCFTCWLRRLLSKKRTSKEGEEVSEGSNGKKKRRKAEVVVIFPYVFCYGVCVLFSSLERFTTTYNFFQRRKDLTFWSSFDAILTTKTFRKKNRQEKLAFLPLFERDIL